MNEEENVGADDAIEQDAADKIVDGQNLDNNQDIDPVQKEELVVEEDHALTVMNRIADGLATLGTVDAGLLTERIREAATDKNLDALAQLVVLANESLLPLCETIDMTKTVKAGIAQIYKLIELLGGKDIVNADMFDNALQKAAAQSPKGNLDFAPNADALQPSELMGVDGVDGVIAQLLIDNGVNTVAELASLNSQEQLDLADAIDGISDNMLENFVRQARIMSGIGTKDGQPNVKIVMPNTLTVDQQNDVAELIAALGDYDDAQRENLKHEIAESMSLSEPSIAVFIDEESDSIYTTLEPLLSIDGMTYTIS